MKPTHVSIYCELGMSAGGYEHPYYRVALICEAPATDPIRCDPYNMPWFKAEETFRCERTVAHGILEGHHADSIAEHVAAQFGVDVLDMTDHN